ncbi:MAG: 30S ribosomal protein S6 [Clostridia bacterium]|nr:30S ribosomal protein S6 [Clostridia bacterium]
MNKYEVLYILDAKLDDGEKDALIERFKGVVETANGTVESVDKWGVRKLAYEINFKNEGYYVLMNFSADANTPDDLERQMRITDGVMRFIVIKK